MWKKKKEKKKNNESLAKSSVLQKIFLISQALF